MQLEKCDGEWAAGALGLAAAIRDKPSQARK
jgi:hypothetical protein